LEDCAGSESTMSKLWSWFSNIRQSQELHEQLWRAILDDDLTGVMQAISSGANLRAQYRSNEPDPPLVNAACGASTAVLQALIEGGADVNQQGMGGMTPLMAAAFGGRAPIVEMLVSQGANTAIRDKDDMTALDHAANCVDKLKGRQVSDILLRAGRK
jgi:ankyrin repeat protein